MTEKSKELFDIDTPIMYVIGISEVLYDFQLLIQVKQCLENKQYKVAIVTDQELKEHYDNVYSLYDFFSDGLSVEKLIEANHFIKQIEMSKPYDLLIIGIEKGTVSFGREIPENLGISVYGISQIVPPDCVLLQIFWGDYKKDDFEKLGYETERLIGEKIDFFNIKNYYVDINLSSSNHRIIPVLLESSVINSTTKELDLKNVFALNCQEEIEKLCNAAIETLHSYAEIERM